MKRIIAVLLAVVMCFGVIAFPASAVNYRDDFPNTHRNTGRNLADLIAVAKTQIGYTELNTSTGQPLGTNEDNGYTKYGAWFGAPTVAWCAFFVSWCANQAGISSSVIPRIGNCEIMTNWYKNIGRYLYASSTTPRTGDLIFYNWGGGSVAEHIGIVTGVSGNQIYTVEGNTGSSYGYRCEAKTRTMGAYYIIGYARPAYNDASTYVGSYSFSEYAARKYKAYQKSGRASGGGSYTGTSQLAVITGTAQDIKGKSATLIGRIDNKSSYNIAYAGFYFGKDKNNMTIYGDYYGSSKRILELSMDISKRYGALKPAETYYYCAYVSINGKVYKGPVYSLKTVDDRPQMIVLSDESVNMEVGETYEIFSAILPLEAGETKIKWSSDDKSVVTVKDGMLTGKNPGRATVKAKCDYGNVSAECSVAVALAPVEDVCAESVSDKEIKVSWSSYDNPYLSEFEIYRSEMPNSGFEKIGSADSGETTFTDKKVRCGRYYYYKIKSLGFFDEYNSSLSKSVAVKAVPSTPVIDQIKQHGASFSVTWNEVKGVKNYNVYRSMMPERGYSLIAETDEPHYTDSNIFFGKKYYYKVTAVKDGVQSGFSDYKFKIAGEITLTEPDPLMKIIME